MKNTKAEYDNITKFVKMPNYGTRNLNQTLETAKNCSNKEGIGYNNKKEDLKKKIEETIFVQAKTHDLLKVLKLSM